MDALRDFHVSFFAMRRLALFQWMFVEENLQKNKSSVISEILEQTCLHPLCRTFPPSVRYRRSFLSELIRRQEALDGEYLDDLYEAFAEVIGEKEKNECYKSYILPSGDVVSLQESVAVISEGTTGLVTWEASQYLSEWALEHTQMFRGRSVLELGSGVGLVGVVICRCCSPSTFVFSDCHDSVLDKLRRNVELNGLTEPAVRVQPLDWTTVTEAQLKEAEPDVVIAADVVYDPDVVVVLVNLLSKILKCSSKKPDVFVCSTVRNQETYDNFKQQLETSGLCHHVIPGRRSHIFPSNSLSDIELIKVHT
ncbi:protein-lysine N-methyltransferase EEF2KMT-like isoform X1 [Gouania willdenowi]|uniref:protein-lysine N-methyltransferase EEF2KMT-like isoform X1 n=1 Tax=Gouania willdenowi TaxID=441366 RepID=UPI001055A0B8|nr:protein-lysine N-methyltransferase EEF2KMT-like isoform X1 [Gouania willdenowi]XP_028310291.1 protein-lysine N-methyltransferase EEF2KMT-like isoform X1 [Gouania willdenowi]